MKNGFTIIEILVSVAVFSVITLISLGIFTFTLKSQKQSLADQRVIAQTSYAIEYMGRAVRMALKDVSGSCIGANLNYATNAQSNSVKFLNYKGVCQEFFLDGVQLKQNLAGNILPLTSPKLRVASFKIGPGGSWDQGDDEQPRITIFFQLEDISGKTQAKINLQTTISQRNLDTRR